jgi:DUF1009 family protein
VQKGKLAACAFPDPIQLKRVDLPTLGNPTIPQFKDISQKFLMDPKVIQNFTIIYFYLPQTDYIDH